MKKRSNEEYLALLATSGKFKALEVYVNATTPILHKCIKCEYEWSVRPQQLLRVNSGCPKCTSWKNSEDKISKVLADAGLEALTKYTGSLDPITLLHKKCGYTWETKYSYIQQGSGCPSCNIGFGFKSKDRLPEIAKLYLLDIITCTGEHFLKVGITSQLMSRRISSISSEIGQDLISIRPILVVEGSGENILSLEKSIHNNKTIPRYQSRYKFDGYTETKNFSCRDELKAIIEKDQNVKTILSTR